MGLFSNSLWIVSICLFSTLVCDVHTTISSTSEQQATKSAQNGELAEAEALMKQAKEYHHMSTPQYAASISLYQRALQIKERKLGHDHPETAECMRSLAENYRILGYFDKALPLARQALAIQEKSLGLENLDTAKTMRTLAWITVNQAGYSSQALSLAEKALQITENTLGPDHVEVSYCLYTLAEIHRQMGSYEQAINTAQRALKIRQGKMEPGHKEISYSFRQVGFIYLALKNYQLAEGCFRK